MPRKSNPYGYTIVENAYTHPIIRWDDTTPHMELPPSIKETTTSDGEHHKIITHDNLVKEACKEAARVAGVAPDDVINAIAAYRNIAVSLIANGVDVNLLDIVSVKPKIDPNREAPENTRATKRVSTRVTPNISGLIRLSEERPDLPITPQNWVEQLFEHGSHIRKTIGWNYKEGDRYKAAGEHDAPKARRYERTYEQALQDLKTGAPPPPQYTRRKNQP